jgi:hypothetical protein
VKTKLFQSLSAYKELIQTGGIQCTAEGENVFLEIKGNLAGDILVFISPKNKNTLSLADLHELIQADNRLEEQRNFAFNSLRQKYKRLSSLPVSILWNINIVFSVLYTYLNSNKILELFGREIKSAEILTLLPLVFFTVITPILSKVYGLKILKPFLSLIINIIRFIRKIRNRQIA